MSAPMVRRVNGHALKELAGSRYKAFGGTWFKVACECGAVPERDMKRARMEEWHRAHKQSLLSHQAASEHHEVMTERTETPRPPEPLTEQELEQMEWLSDGETGRCFSVAIKAAARLRYLETQHEALMRMLERTTDQLDSFDGCAPSEALACDTCNLIDEANELMASLSPLPAQAAKDGQ